MRRLATTLALLLVACSLGPAAAERLVVSLSNHRVAVTSNFVGEELVLFGTIEPDQATGQLRPPYDLVVTVTGPQQTLRTRRKERIPVAGHPLGRGCAHALQAGPAAPRQGLVRPAKPAPRRADRRSPSGNFSRRPSIIPLDNVCGVIGW